MDDQLIERIDFIIESNTKGSSAYSIYAEALSLFKMYEGQKSEYYTTLKSLQNSLRAHGDIVRIRTIHLLKSFKRIALKDMISLISKERKIQIETVSDILDQAQSLLSSKKVHAGAPAVLIGAALEEFCRNWLEDQGVELESKKMNLSSYIDQLRKMELIDKQDVKDLISWSGLRNDAAHGHWQKVEDKNKIELMLLGVNLFMRKYSIC